MTRAKTHYETATLAPIAVLPEAILLGLHSALSGPSRSTFGKRHFTALQDWPFQRAGRRESGLKLGVACGRSVLQLGGRGRN
jgi:hypothetical protein